MVKADGLAVGKGVTVCADVARAEAEIRKIFRAASGDGARVIVEEAVRGIEASFIAMCDGKTAMAMEPSQDHKRVGDGDRGPNTGGMGAYSPTPFVTDALARRIESEIIGPAIAGMRGEGFPFCGFLYAGVMIDPDGGVSVLEFNARMGDPECQPIMMRANFDLYEYIEAAERGGLASMGPMQWTSRHAACVVLASRGYPASYPTGQEITGIGEDTSDSVVFHAGTRRGAEGVVTGGGRVLGVTASGPTLQDALDAAYARADAISWESKFCRRDIGHAAAAR